MLAKLTPRERNKLTFKRKRDKGFITDLGWTRAILYAGCKVLLVDLVVVVNKFHIVKGIFLNSILHKTTPVFFHFLLPIYSDSRLVSDFILVHLINLI